MPLQYACQVSSVERIFLIMSSGQRGLASRNAWRMIEKVKSIASSLFEDAEPACVRGACSDGRRCCGAAQPHHPFSNL